MTEEDTYKILKGLTFDEAKVVANQVFNSSYKAKVYKMWSEIEIDIDKELLPYGWSYNRLVLEGFSLGWSS